jgi:hypothetical protein
MKSCAPTAILNEVIQSYPDLSFEAHLFSILAEMIPEAIPASLVMKNNQAIDAASLTEGLCNLRPSLSASNFQKVTLGSLPALSPTDCARVIWKCTPNSTFRSVTEEVLSYYPPLSLVDACIACVTCAPKVELSHAVQDVLIFYPRITLMELFRICHEWLPEQRCFDLCLFLTNGYPELRKPDAIGELIGTCYCLADVLRTIDRLLLSFTPRDIPKTLRCHVSRNLADAIQEARYKERVCQCQLHFIKHTGVRRWVKIDQSFSCTVSVDSTPSLAFYLNKPLVMTRCEIQCYKRSSNTAHDMKEQCEIEWRIEFADGEVPVKRTKGFWKGQGDSSMPSIDQWQWMPFECRTTKSEYAVITGYCKTQWIKFTGVKWQVNDRDHISVSFQIEGFQTPSTIDEAVLGEY